MSLRARRPETTPEEHEQAIRDAEFRLGRKLTTAEQRIDIVGTDRDLKAGKAALHDAVKAEQRRAIEEWVTSGTPIHLRVTDAMIQAISDLYDAGIEHATAELKAAGIDVGN